MKNLEKTRKILEYYIKEDIEYLYYEGNTYPKWISRQELINHIISDMEKVDEIPNKEKLHELFRDFFTYHNDSNRNSSSVDQYFNEWFDACTANGGFTMGLIKKVE